MVYHKQQWYRRTKSLIFYFLSFFFERHVKARVVQIKYIICTAPLRAILQINVL